MEEEKRPIGRPSKYRPEYCEQLIDFMAEGYSFEAFAGKIRVNQDTLHEWVKRHPDFSEAKKIAWSVSRLYLDKAFVEGLWNTKDGPTLNNTTWIFAMKNRFGWRDRVEHRESAKDEFEIPANLLPE